MIRDKEDYISRQEAIEAILFAGQPFYDGEEDFIPDDAVDAIKELPHIEPHTDYTEQDMRDTFNDGYACGQEARWIPTQYQLPTPRHVTKDDDGDEFRLSDPILFQITPDDIRVGRYEWDDDETDYFVDSGSMCYRIEDVIAWQWLPEPYREDSTS